MIPAPLGNLLANLPATVAAKIAAALPGLRECSGMSGGFDLEDLKAQGIAAPAVRVSAMNIRPIGTGAGPHRRWGVEMAAFIITKDALGLSRDVAAANIAQALLILIPDQNWSTTGYGPAERVELKVLVGTQSRKLAAHLSAVVWLQPVVLSTLPPVEEIPIQLYAGQDPDIGPGNEDAYDPIGEAG
ncbi:MAG: hypothetical protein KDJ98_15130 [Rhodobacteraceae bacterium]|nr:hypothetical protein [Paracoccaceae bacterium]